MLGGGLTSRSHPANHPFSSLQPPTLHPTMKSLLAALLGLALLGAAVADEWEKPEWCKVGFGPFGVGVEQRWLCWGPGASSKALLATPHSSCHPPCLQDKDCPRFKLVSGPGAQECRPRWCGRGPGAV